MRNDDGNDVFNSWKFGTSFSFTVVGHSGADPGKTETSLLLRPWQL